MIVDWRDSCTKIKDQGNCGSCTAFGTIGAWECLLKILNEEPVDLSEQNLFICGGGSCWQGSYMAPILDQAVKGVPLEDCCPYVAKDTQCSNRCDEWWVDGKRLASYQRLPTSIEALKNELRKGPIVATMAVPQSFLSYTSGIYHRLSNDPIVGYHCVCLVGYDEENRAWLLRNSWSEDWGMLGYCWIRFGECEIEGETYSLELDGEIEPDDDDNDIDVPWSWIAVALVILFIIIAVAKWLL